MNFGESIDQQLENIKKLLRKIENFEKKLANARVAILFNIYIYSVKLIYKFVCFYFFI